MPTDDQNAQFLYLILTHGGSPTIDWDPICETLDLKKGAATKRWSRLKQAMEKGEAPGESAYQFLWLCLKHSTRDKAMDWKAIADMCNTTKGAASKRYSRLKLAIERGEGFPGSPATTQAGSATTTPMKTPKAPVKTPSKSGTPLKSATPSMADTPSKSTGWTPVNNFKSVDPETPPPSSSKRKRAVPRKKISEEYIKAEPEDDGSAIEEKKAKRPRSTKKNAVVKDEEVDEMPAACFEDEGDVANSPCPKGMPAIGDEEASMDEHDYLQNECAESLSPGACV